MQFSYRLDSTSLFYSTYTDTTIRSRPGSRRITAVKSADCVTACSASRSLRTQSMLRIGQPVSCIVVSIIVTQLLWLIELVITLSFILLAYGILRGTMNGSMSDSMSDSTAGDGILCSMSDQKG
ncbi:hypothetical protein HRG_003326 [Hirsutella rhossiliensis]|uniref:Uncharacterized protein n=1 Tax=Hirsutella rhossiliensis TaxID=111463 RepID=A0A9P8N1T4_9HYPO|nr:uncharacterized protein HRG_03326 [Hirsutella rhossiliensis]KAH0965310.1 hypothetical protein HRG_03326 [Hirsutella rhossiliensis]